MDTREKFQKTSHPNWIDDMIRHYQETGTYRPKDLYRLLGDQRRGVSSGPNMLENFKKSLEEKKIFEEEFNFKGEQDE